VASNDPGISRDRFIRLIDCVTADNDSTATDPRLGVHDCIAANHRRPAVDSACHIEIAKQDEDTSCDIAFDLDRTEDAGCVMDLLALADKDVLIEIGSGAVVMALPASSGSGEEKKDKAQESGCEGHHRSLLLA
jgi:hypothetical protein